MESPVWPGVEVLPSEERPLLAVARLRRYGVNYLQDAVCPGLGLLAHLDGTTVRLLRFPPRRPPDESSEADCNSIVAEIDLEAGRRSPKPDSTGVKNSEDREAGKGAKQGSATPSEGLARGLSWAKCVHAATTAAAAKANGGCVMDGGSTLAEGMERKVGNGIGEGGQQERWEPSVGSGVVGTGNAGRGDSGGDRDSDGGCGGQDGDKVCHIAVACGPEVLLWRVSLVSCGEQKSSGAGMGGEGGTKHRRSYRYSAVLVRTEWHTPEERSDRGGGGRGGNSSGNTSVHQGPDDDGMSPKERTPATFNDGEGQDLSSLAGNVRCLSFRPCTRGGVGASMVTANEDGAVPLAAWYDTGAAVLGPGGSRVVLPAPVRRKRACGAWSGCGRRLALSSGGEIRVYNDPWGQQSPSTAAVVEGDGDESKANVVPGSHPWKNMNAWVGRDASVVVGGDASDILPVAIGVRESELPGKSSATPTDRLGAECARSMFRTVLCVEATLYEGGVLSSPGSSPGGTPCPSPPRRNHSSRRLVVDKAKDDGEDKRLPLACATSVPLSAAEGRNGTELDGGQKPSAPRTAPPPEASATRASLSKIVLGDMRAMCAAGPLAFFGATDGGLGLDSVFSASGTAEASGAFLTGGDRGGTKKGGDGLLGAIVDTSNSAGNDGSNPVGGNSVDFSARRYGFRHILPGENWLAGSLRPSSRALRPDSPPRQKDSLSRTRPTRSFTSTEGASVVSSAASTLTEGGKSDRNVSPRASRLTSVSPPSGSPAEPEVLDLRGKLGGGVLGTGGVVVEGAANRDSAVSTHPLFHLSLPGGGGGGADPLETSTARSSVFSRSASSITCSTSNNTSRTGNASTAPGRGPWLVRASCRSSSVSVKALAPLPPGLASPDLLASSEDGHFVAVGGHACDLVACYHLERQASPRAEENVPDSPRRDPAGNGGQGSPVDRNGARRQKRRQRRAVPVCTLRLPVGYRAKGLAFARDEKLGGSDDVTAMSRSRSVARDSVAECCGAAARDVVVLVLAGCVVSNNSSGSGDARRPGKHGTSLRADSGGGGVIRSLSDASYRTVLLKFSLPSGCSAGDGQSCTTTTPARALSVRKDGAEMSGDGKLPERSRVRDGNDVTDQDRTLGSNTNVAVAAKPSTASVGSGRCSSKPQGEGIRDLGGTGGGGSTTDARLARLETAVLQAVAGVERRIDERFNQMEKVLGSVCDRLEALEGAVHGHHSTTALSPSAS